MRLKLGTGGPPLGNYEAVLQGSKKPTTSNGRRPAVDAEIADLEQQLDQASKAADAALSERASVYIPRGESQASAVAPKKP